MDSFGSFFCTIAAASFLLGLEHFLSLVIFTKKKGLDPIRNPRYGKWVLRNGVILLGASMLLGIVVMSTNKLFGMYLSENSAGLLNVLALLGGILALGNIGNGRRLNTVSAEDVIRSSEKKPVLYLRSFLFDETKTDIGIIGMGNFEQNLAQITDRVGPMIAIGKPGEKFAAMGAARVYVGDDEWKGKILEYIEKSQCVLWVYGDTEGLRWEISKLVKIIDPTKLIICLPIWDLKQAQRDEMWAKFTKELSPTFAKPFPSQLGPALFVHFRSDWTPLLVGVHTSWVVRIKTIKYRMFLAREGLKMVFAEKGLHYKIRPNWFIHLKFYRTLIFLLLFIFLVFILPILLSI